MCSTWGCLTRTPTRPFPSTLGCDGGFISCITHFPFSCSPLSIQRPPADGPMTIILGLLVLKAAGSCCHFPPLCSCPSCPNDLLPSHPKILTYVKHGQVLIPRDKMATAARFDSRWWCHAIVWAAGALLCTPLSSSRWIPSLVCFLEDGWSLSS